MPTNAPPRLVTAVAPITITLHAPLHHGAGTAGNTAMQRVQEITHPGTGQPMLVPFLSGASVRHAVRDAAARITLDACAIGRTTKPVVDLLFSGGALTAGGGGNVDLATHRRLDELWPVAGLLGYAGPGNIWQGTLKMDHTHLVCAENAWRLPGHLTDHPHAAKPAASFLDEDFGTRHDAADTAERWMDLDLWDPSRKSAQMITDWQVIKAGAIMYTTMRLHCGTVRHAQALRAAWDHLTWTDGRISLGAKTAQGYGLATADVDWSNLPDPDPEYAATMAEHRDELVALLAVAAGT